MTKYRYVLVSQHRQEVYVSVAQYDDGYLKYMKGEDKDSDRSFLTMHCFGPWDILYYKHIHQIARLLLDFTIQVSMEQSP